jgi:GNAT superfamily N-acetyltransferase
MTLANDTALTVRAIEPHERGAVLDLLDEWISRDFFARYFEHDPAFRDELCFVAVDGDRIVSTLQVFGKDVRTNGSTLRVGGIGNVFTTASHREHGIASRLLSRAIAAMEEHGFDLSLLFAVRLAFYGRHGWGAHPRLFVFLEPARPKISDRYVIERFAVARDLDAVMNIYDTHSGSLAGTTVRDRRYWGGQLGYAGNPGEDFLVARAGGKTGAVVAYARGTTLYGYYLIMEHGYLPGHEEALTDLVCRLHAVEGAALPGTLSQLTTEQRVLEALGGRGIEHRRVEDVFWMWRVISPARLADKLGLTPDEVGREDFLHRLFPPEQSVFWLSDRF